MYFQYIHLPVCQLPVRVYWVRGSAKPTLWLDFGHSHNKLSTYLARGGNTTITDTDSNIYMMKIMKDKMIQMQSWIALIKF